MGNYGKAGYNPKPNAKLGSVKYPLTLTVCSPERKREVELLLTEHKLAANIEINADVNENLAELDSVLNKPQTQRFDKTPERNEPCLCGSGKKYKKCCG